MSQGIGNVTVVDIEVLITVEKNRSCILDLFLFNEAKQCKKEVTQKSKNMLIDTKEAIIIEYDTPKSISVMERRSRRVYG